MNYFFWYSSYLFTAPLSPKQELQFGYTKWGFVEGILSLLRL